MEPHNFMPSHEPIHIIAAGDICPGDHFSMGFGTASLARSHGPLFAFKHVENLLRQGDIVFGNCEGVVSDIGADPNNIDTMEFRGPPEFARALRDSGFTVMAVANNHTGEHGLETLHDTVNNLRSAGIKVIGLRGQHQTAEPLIQEIKGLRIGWLSYTWIVSKHVEQDCNALSWTKGTEVAAEITAVRRNVDFLIVSAHWGREFVTVPPQKIIGQAHIMAEAGADLILGHHPHVLQGTEQHQNGLIVYSLGNFVFDMWQPALRETALFRCTIENTKISNSEFIPLQLNRHFQPMLATETQASRILRAINQSTRAISDPDLASLREDTTLANIEAAFKRRLFRQQLLYLAGSIFRMGPRIAYQKIGRRISLAMGT
jgi:gamma-polyglutamate biosynthesis protein CapA